MRILNKIRDWATQPTEPGNKKSTPLAPLLAKAPMRVVNRLCKHEVAPPAQVAQAFAKIAELVDGAQRQRLRNLYRPELRDQYEVIKHGQSPNYLVITCSDSRVSPPAVFNRMPGSMFEQQNMGNLVVLDDGHHTPDLSMESALEYALDANLLNVGHIVILGHTGCGAVAGWLKPESVAKFPRVSTWIANAGSLAKRVQTYYGPLQGSEILLAGVAENVLTQVERLRRHPLVKARLEKNDLDLHGLVFEIENHGVVSGWDEGQQQFVPLNAEKTILPRRQSNHDAK